MQLVAALGLVGANPQQGLPYPLHVIRLAPGAVSPQVHVEHPVHPIEQRILKNMGEVEAQAEEEQETSQFHSQDSSGRSMFGYVLPGQVRIEARRPDGSVRGSYSYLDPTGRAVKVRSRPAFCCCGAWLTMISFTSVVSYLIYTIAIYYRVSHKDSSGLLQLYSVFQK